MRLCRLPQRSSTGALPMMLQAELVCHLFPACTQRFEGSLHAGVSQYRRSVVMNCTAAIPALCVDQLQQCQQLLAALSWMSNQGIACGHLPELAQLRDAAAARGNALQDAALEEHGTLRRIQLALGVDSRAVATYPASSLLECLKSVFLSDPHGPQVAAATTEARARLVLYYFWDAGIPCDWRVCCCCTVPCFAQHHTAPRSNTCACDWTAVVGNVCSS